MSVLNPSSGLCPIGVREMTQCPSGFALPSGYAAIEVERLMLKVLVAFPPVGGLAESRPTSRRVVAVRRTTGVDSGFSALVFASREIRRLWRFPRLYRGWIPCPGLAVPNNCGDGIG